MFAVVAWVYLFRHFSAIDQIFLMTEEN